MITRQRIGAFAYGSMFCALLPWLLAKWATATRSAVQMPAYGTPAGGFMLIAGGGTLMLLGVLALWRRGGGFMNALPPKRLVTTDVYRWLPHPMYLGFALATLGVAMVYQSPSGLWLVAPAVMLGCAARVFGYEAPNLERRFGAAAQGYHWLPEDRDGSPAGMARIRCYLFLLLPWVAIYEIIVWSGAPKDAFTLALPFERNWPPMAWAEPVYMSTYIVVGLTPLLARTSRSLRQFMLQAWLAMAISFSLYLALPVMAPHKPFSGTGFWARALEMERSADPPLNAFPSFHTIWAFLTAELVIAGRGRLARWLWRSWAVAIAVSCVATGQHWIADVAAGFLLSMALIRAGALWALLRGSAERIANSWQEWEIGPFRIVNHSIYAGVAVAVTLGIAGTLAGSSNEPALAMSAATGLAGAILWARWVEGSRRFRPYGYYGGLIGVGAACLAAPLTGGDGLLLAAAYCVAAPWLQAVGRLRCLVQGCCHGKVAPHGTGILYEHPKAQESQGDGCLGLPLHPTPLYSILWSLFVALVLGRMWWAGCELRLVAGIFLILSGMGRFVEEAYRGESHVPVYAGLRLYQWLSTATVAAGAVITTLPIRTEAPPPIFSGSTVVVAGVFAVVAAAALGVDYRRTRTAAEFITPVDY